MKNEIIDILQLTEPYNDKIQVLSKPHMRSSKSLGNLDNRIKAPDEVRFNCNSHCCILKQVLTKQYVTYSESLGHFVQQKVPDKHVVNAFDIHTK